jgi:hypothetical protein
MIFVMLRNGFLTLKDKSMSSEKQPSNIGQSVDETQNQDTISTNASLGATMVCNERINKIMQDYYNKASGCSVKSQKAKSFGYGTFTEV